MESMGFNLREEAVLETLTKDVVKSSEIEGEILNPLEVRSSVARRLGMEISGLPNASRDVEGVVEMMLDATQKYEAPITKDRICGWHAALFPTGRSGMHTITVGEWRGDEDGPMQVVSGAMGKEKVHYTAPEAPRVEEEMNQFMNWFNSDESMEPVIKSAIAHLWFVSIHPFDYSMDGKLYMFPYALGRPDTENPDRHKGQLIGPEDGIRDQLIEYFSIEDHIDTPRFRKSPARNERVLSQDGLFAWQAKFNEPLNTYQRFPFRVHRDFKNSIATELSAMGYTRDRILSENRFSFG